MADFSLPRGAAGQRSGHSGGLPGGGRAYAGGPRPALWGLTRTLPVSNLLWDGWSGAWITGCGPPSGVAGWPS